jgi:lysyl-tRNA synthetase class 2
MEDNQLILERKKKLEQWKALGFGYAQKFDRTHTATQAREFVQKNSTREVNEIFESAQSDVRMCGRIMNMRDMGKLAFLKIRDVSGDFQICLAKNTLGEDYKTMIKILDLGDFCGFEGEFFVTKHGEPSLLASTVTPLAKTLRPLPEKFHGLTDREACYRQRYLDMTMNPETYERFHIRSQVVREIRNYMEQKDFIEVETRTILPQAGGAMAKVFETHHNALDSDFVLRIALELDLKMAVSGGMERVFEIGKCFRNEGMDPSHLQEFTMLEWYAAYQDLETNMEWTEDMIKTIMQNVIGTTTVTILDKNENPIEIDFGGAWKRARFPDLLKQYADLDMFTATEEEIRSKAIQIGIPANEVEKTGRANLLDDIYKKTTRPTLIEPTFVTDYPSELKPLARPNDDGTASCAQLLVGGWEMSNAYGELVDPQIQRKLLEEQSQAKAAGDEEAMEVDEEFLGAMEHGMPPMTGFGMGIDRFTAIITRQPNLRDVVLFPLMRRED